jgi:hypothetical protein
MRRTGEELERNWRGTGEELLSNLKRIIAKTLVVPSVIAVAMQPAFYEKLKEQCHFTRNPYPFSPAEGIRVFIWPNLPDKFREYTTEDDLARDRLLYNKL